MIAVNNPTGRARILEPALSRSNHAGAATAATTANRIASSDHRQHAAVPAGDVEGHHQVHDDVADRDDLGALELGPAPGGDHEDQERADHQQ